MIGVVQAWSRDKLPAERDVRYAYFTDDLPEGEIIVAATAVTEEGDVVVESTSYTNTRVAVVLSGGTKNSIIRITVTTDEANVIVGRALQRIDQ